MAKLGSANSSLFTALLLAIFLVGPALGLKCYFQTAGPDDAAPGDKKEYECRAQDKYCVDFGGILRNPVKNLTLQLKSCEGDVKRYLDPISSKIGEKIDFECATSDGKKKELGPLTYWYNCCTSDDCNNAAISSMAMFKVIASCLFLTTLLSILH